MRYIVRALAASMPAVALIVTPLHAEGAGAEPAATSTYEPIMEPSLTRDPSADPRDFEGTYLSRGYPMLIGEEADFTPSALAVRKHRQAVQQAGQLVASPHVTCRPAGTIFALTPIFPTRIVQNKERILVYMEELRSIREIFMNVDHPADLESSYQGHSVGHWEGDTLVVDTIGFNARTWLDHSASPHSDKLHVVERITKAADGGLDLKITFDDPETLVRPLSIERHWQWITGTRQVEDDCEENPSPDQVMGFVYDDEYLRPVCTAVMDDAGSRVVCDRRKTIPAEQAPEAGS